MRAARSRRRAPFTGPSARALIGLVGLLGCADAACSGDGGETTRPAAASRPRLVASSFVDSEHVPLAGTLKITVDRSATIAVVAVEPGGHRVEIASAGAATEHEIPILQLRAGRAYTLTITATSADGATSEPTTIARRTPDLPADFPPLRVVTANRSGAGLTLFPVSRFQSDDGTVARWGYVVAVDAAGEVVWFVDTQATVAEVERGSRGQIRYGFDDRGIAEITPLGTIERALLAEGPSRDPKDVPAGFVPVAVDTMHHDVVELPNGHWLTLSTEKRTLGPTDCATYDKTYDVIGDVVVELDPDSGKVLGQTSMFDLLDPCRRVDAYFESAFWFPVYGESADWTHANAVFHDAARNAVLVSLRHQDWVIAYRYAGDAAGPAGALLWKLGPEGDFALEGAGAMFPYHQHAARVLPNGNLTVFDNGTSRPGTDDFDITKLPSSRAAEFSLDTSGPPSSWKATQVWQYGQGEVREIDTSTGTPVDVGYYSSVVGDAVTTPDGTVLITEGALTSPAAGFVLDPALKKSARIVEVAREGSPDVVFDLRVEDPAKSGFTGYLVYRAKRVPTLYPPGGATAKATMP